jgi:hypothetical protein
MRCKPPLLWLAVLYLALPAALVAQDLPFGLSLPPSLNFAASPSPVGSGARAQGQAIAFIGVADDATAASHNPGGLLQLLRPEASIVGSYFIRFEEQDITQPGTVVENQTLDSFNLNYLSVAYPFEIFQRNVVVSFNVQRLFDLQGVTDVASRFTTVNGIQRVRSRQDGGLFTFSPAVAVEITPTFAVGVAFNIWPDLFDNGWDQDVSVEGEGSVRSGNRIVPFVSEGRIQEKFAFEGFNVTIGFLWEVSPILSLGGVLRTPFTAKVTRTHTSSLTVTLLDGSEPVTSTRSFRETLDMDMPWAYGLGIALRLTDRLRLSFDVSRVHWSDFRLEASTQEGVLLVENGAPSGKGQAVLNGESDDTTTVRLGAQYLWPGPRVAFRAGGFYDPEPGDGGTDDFWGFSVGSGITLNKVVLDLAYTFRTGTVESEATDTSVYQHKLLLSMIYHF